jgi:MFS superfamily sulfate permease-like transporter
VLRPEEPLFFANAEPLMTLVREQVMAQPQLRLIVLSLEESPDLDSTAIEALGELSAWLQKRGMELRVARLKESARDALSRAQLVQLPAGALDYSSVDDAVRGECVAPLPLSPPT